MSKVHSQDKGPSIVGAANCPVLAPTAVGHQYRWKVDSRAGQLPFTLVAIEYFTKWIGAKPLTNVSSTSIKKFFWQNVIYRYGVPWYITIDNVKYFDNAIFKDFCQ
jgi:hypothetical protein